jgi:hypothetical protein
MGPSELMVATIPLIPSEFWSPLALSNLVRLDHFMNCPGELKPHACFLRYRKFDRF